jgi:hypothetical protein
MDVEFWFNFFGSKWTLDLLLFQSFCLFITQKYKPVEKWNNNQTTDGLTVSFLYTETTSILVNIRKEDNRQRTHSKNLFLQLFSINNQELENWMKFKKIKSFKPFINISSFFSLRFYYELLLGDIIHNTTLWIVASF